jgi:hypothetical protein
MVKKAAVLTHQVPARQDAPLRMHGRSERGNEAYPLGYVEDPSKARTKLEAFSNILLPIRR